MTLIHFPAWTTANIVLTSLQVAGALGGVQEFAGDNAGYSKFAHEDAKFKVASRPAMILLYAPSFVVGLYAMMIPLVSTSGSNGREFLFAALLTAHYGKRCLEVLFVHNYSGTMDGDIMCVISVFYLFTSINLAYQQQHVAVYDDPMDSFMLFSGVVLFALGQFGNLYHHMVLATLRPSPSPSKAAALVEKRYVIPTDGFFQYVTMPHYFFEVISWFGLACVAQQFNSFITMCGMALYLSGRSAQTTKWYKSKFPEYPPERKHIFPFVF